VVYTDTAIDKEKAEFLRVKRRRLAKVWMRVVPAQQKYSLTRKLRLDGRQWWLSVTAA